MINYYWRIIASGLCFVLFGIGGVVLSLGVFPLQNLFIRNIEARKRIARNTVSHVFRFFIGLIAFLRIYSFSFQEVEQLKNLKGHLVLANHPTLIDVVLLISIVPNADCIVKSHLLRNPFMRGVIKATGYIANDKADSLLEDCQKSLAKGNNLILFPQGTRTPGNQVIKFQRGAANIAVRCNAKLKTILFNVSPSTLTKGTPWYKIPKKKAHFCIEVVANELQMPENSANNISQSVRQYNRTLEQFFIKELQKYG